MYADVVIERVGEVATSDVNAFLKAWLPVRLGQGNMGIPGIDAGTSRSTLKMECAQPPGLDTVFAPAARHVAII